MVEQINSNDSVSIDTTSINVLPARDGINFIRTQFSISNTSAAAVATVAVSEVAAVAGVGYPLQPKQAYLESSDSGFKCWQGPVQVVSDVAGTVAVTERLEAVKRR
jgi:hypothetical protein